MPPDIAGTLEHIQEAAGFIDADTAGLTFDAFLADRRTRQAVERNFEIMGEAVNRLRRHAPEIAERISASNQIVGFRNQLSHGYDRIDYPTVWRAVQEALPELRSEVEALLREAEGR
jgi:uncharacterized protein with HEPN domain